MRMCYVLLAVMATLLSNIDAATPVTNSIKISDEPSPNALSVSTSDDTVIRKRSLRIADADDDDDDTLSENEEERAGGTSLVKSIHNIDDYTDAWMLRQVAKGNSPAYTLDKLKVPYKTIHGERIYSLDNAVYERYLHWVKYDRDRTYFD